MEDQESLQGPRLTMARLRIVAVLPGPAAIDLKLKGQTEKCANENDEAQNDHVVEGRINNDRPYISPATRNSSPRKIARPISWRQRR